MSDLRERLLSSELGESLAALRAILADALLSAEPKEVPPIAKVFETVTTHVLTLAPPERSASDDLAARRADRRSAAQASQRPARRGVDSGTGSS